MQTLPSGIATLLLVAGFAMLALEPAGQFASHRSDAAIQQTIHAIEHEPEPRSSARLAADSSRLPTTATSRPLEARPDPTVQPPTPAANRPSAVVPVSRIPSAGDSSAVTSAPAGPTATPLGHPREPVQWLPITRLKIPRIGLAAEVVPAPLIEVGGDRTWKVPSFKVGHGQFTAGAGQVGNAVLLGHVASVREGSVFRDLHRVHVGDTIRVFSGERQFDYRVVQVRVVSPTDVSVLRPTGVASLIMITCAGKWVPSLNDYSERLVVRAILVTPQN